MPLQKIKKYTVLSKDLEEFQSNVQSSVDKINYIIEGKGTTGFGTYPSRGFDPPVENAGKQRFEPYGIYIYIVLYSLWLICKFKCSYVETSQAR